MLDRHLGRAERARRNPSVGDWCNLDNPCNASLLTQKGLLSQICNFFQLQLAGRQTLMLSK